MCTCAVCYLIHHYILLAYDWHYMERDILCTVYGMTSKAKGDVAVSLASLPLIVIVKRLDGTTHQNIKVMRKERHIIVTQNIFSLCI